MYIFNGTQAERGEEEEEVKMDGFGKTDSTGRIGRRQEVPEGFQEDKKKRKDFRRQEVRKDFRKTRSTGRISKRPEVPEGFQKYKKNGKDFKKTISSGSISGTLQNKEH